MNRDSDGADDAPFDIKRRNVLQAGGFAAGLGLAGATGLGAAREAPPDVPAGRPDESDPDTHTFLCQNAWIIPEPLWDDADNPLVEKEPSAIKTPENEARASRLGASLAYSHVDVAGFQEVFHEKHREILRQPIQRDLEDAVGPEQAYENAAVSSGLYTLAMGDRRIAETETMVYDNRGNRRRDEDAYAQKGVLFTRLDLGDGVVDLFTTHLLAGGAWPGERVDPSPVRDPASPAEYRRRQLEEFRAFVEDVKAEHDPEGRVPTVCAGDFNIDGDAPEYPALEAFRDALGLTDAWVAVHGDAAGPTDGTAITEACGFDPWSQPPYYCPDDDDSEAAERIDYVFVEDHPAVDVADVRRRVFWRKLDDPREFDAGDGRPNYLADHVGLEVDFRFPE